MNPTSTRFSWHPPCIPPGKRAFMDVLVRGAEKKGEFHVFQDPQFRAYTDNGIFFAAKWVEEDVVRVFLFNTSDGYADFPPLALAVGQVSSPA